MSTSHRKRHVLAFLGPAGLLLLGILVFPIIYSFSLSLHAADGASWFAGTSQFVGLANYTDLMMDQSFIQSIWLLLVYIVITTVVELLIALILAIFLDQVLVVPAWMRTFLILPMFVLPVVSGLTFRYLFDPDGGILGTMFYWFDLEAPDLLGDPIGAFAVVVLQDIWRMWPFLFIIVFAGLKSLPRDTIEAVKMDGANLWQTCRFVILPGLRGTIVVAVLLKVIESLKAFTEIYVMTGGGPGESTTILSMYIIKQITDFSQYGYGSAASTLLLVAGVILTLLLGFYSSRQQQTVGDA